MPRIFWLAAIWPVIDLGEKIRAGLMGEILRHVYRFLIWKARLAQRHVVLDKTGAPRKPVTR
jgi:hypothetical protein